MSHADYDQKLYSDVYQAVRKALMQQTSGVDLPLASYMLGDVYESLKTELMKIFDRVYDEGYESGLYQGKLDES